MREFKVRQAMKNIDGSFHSWHYWGFIDGSFDGIIPPIKEAQERSQQYTGLKDSKSKEIYEGDIVKCRGDVFTVVWDSDCAGFRLSLPSDPKYVWRAWIDIEVIGNIYESPGALPEGQERA